MLGLHARSESGALLAATPGTLLAVIISHAGGATADIVVELRGLITRRGDAITHGTQRATRGELSTTAELEACALICGVNVQPALLSRLKAAN